MEFIGQIYKVFPVQRGTSKSGNDWVKQDFIFEYFENDTDRYADRVLLSIMGTRVDTYAPKELDKVRIGFGHSVREYNGRWFNETRVYKYERLDDHPAQPAPVKEEPATVKDEQKAEPSITVTEQESGLPF